MFAADHIKEAIEVTMCCVSTVAIAVYFIRRFQYLMRCNSIMDCLCDVLLVFIPSVWNGDNITFTIAIFVTFDMWKGYLSSADPIYIILLITHWVHNILCSSDRLQFYCIQIGFLLAIFFTTIFYLWSRYLHTLFFPYERKPVYCDFYIRFLITPTCLIEPIRNSFLGHEPENALKHVIWYSLKALSSLFFPDVARHTESFEHMHQNRSINRINVVAYNETNRRRDQDNVGTQAIQRQDIHPTVVHGSSTHNRHQIIQPTHVVDRRNPSLGWNGVDGRHTTSPPTNPHASYRGTPGHN